MAYHNISDGPAKFLHGIQSTHILSGLLSGFSTACAGLVRLLGLLVHQQLDRLSGVRMHN